MITLQHRKNNSENYIQLLKYLQNLIKENFNKNKDMKRKRDNIQKNRKQFMMKIE